MKSSLFPLVRFSSCFVLLILLVDPSMAQRISIFPQVDSLYFVGSCTPPQMVCELKESSLGIDTIIIRARYNEPLCTGYPPIQTNIIQAFNYIVHDSLNQFRYELWLRPTSYGTSRRLEFDSVYFASPQLYFIVLNVFVGSNMIDSAKIKFHSITTGLSVDDSNNPIPSHISLEQNYPNPFNPSTTIKFSIPQQAIVSLSIYDLLGREVAILVNEEKLPGNYEIRFNVETFHGTSLTSGIYFYRLQVYAPGRAGSFSTTKKFILMK